jgi:hypothetical protein
LGNTATVRQNFKSDKVWREAIQLAVNGRMGPGGMKKLRAIAEKLTNMALDGDIAAIKEIGDRLDGKAIQPISGSLEVTHEQWLEQLPLPSKPYLIVDHDPQTGLLQEIEQALPKPAPAKKKKAPRSGT